MPRRLNRRTLLRGAGVALGLPYLEAMAATTGKPAAPAKRFCSFYFPYGVSLPKEDSDEAKWRWFPTGGERDFQLSYALEPLASVRDDVTILQGLSHPKGRTMGAHDTADTFLTGSSLEGKFLKNTVSVDQVIAAKIGHQTRYSSLVLSTDGGVGEPSRSSTLSFNENGHPIPSLNSPSTVFERLFGAGDSAEQRRTLGSSASMLDRVLEDSARLRSTLGGQDKAKLDEYLESVRQVEQRVERSQAWLDIPRPELTDADREMLQLDADDEAPGELMRTIYDLIYLALRTDSTRVVTYQIGSMGDYSSKAGKFPQLLGYNGTLHSLAHDWNKPGGAEALAKWDRFMASQFAAFLEKLRSSQEGDGTLLDHTLAFYGSSNSQTHNNTNYPLILAGGRAMGLKPGRFLQFSDETPLSNLFVTALDRLDAPEPLFADSTSDLSTL
ncbi:MAG: DUF1552 domain-containing protein [Bryobacterales bacterium]|nr:DUF1552 domain-containing protein [Bryobacterales bacterium]